MGTCPSGDNGQLIVRRSPSTLKRFVRCTNYENCGVSYPLPQRGELTATGEMCAACGAPIVIVNTGRGPWRICVDPNCPAKAEAAAKKAAGPVKKTSARKAPARKRPAKKAE